MPSNAWNGSNPKAGPPAYCHWVKTPLPPILPDPGPSQLQGWARWTQLDDDPPVDIAMYLPMPRRGALFFFEGQATIKGIRLNITFQRIVLPNTWRIALQCWKTPTEWEMSLFEPFQLQLEPSWDTGLRTRIYVPGVDFRQARVTQ